jgi:hypothetical protein
MLTSLLTTAKVSPGIERTVLPVEASQPQQAPYEGPRIELLGSLQELTQERSKVVNPSSDYIYPAGFSFNFS